VLVIPANADACYTDSFMMEYDVHTLLDLLTLSATLWVLYTMRTKLARSYNARKDSTRVELIVRGPLDTMVVPPTRSPVAALPT